MNMHEYHNAFGSCPYPLICKVSVVRERERERERDRQTERERERGQRLREKAYNIIMSYLLRLAERLQLAAD